ncbi:MAG: MFS transporter [Bacteroidales bacterium]|nr:MFS transporter [Bacteroidales bacterium]MBO4566255.1 MFS transporter [Bacteroidales bacterium]
MKIKPITIKLILMNFLEFAVWGAYLTSLGRYLGNIGLGSQIKWFFAMQGIVSIFMPTLMGILADRKIQAQKVLSLCHGIAGAAMIGAGVYCMNAGDAVAFAPLFVLYSISVAFFMPTIALVNSVAYNALGKEGMDPVVAFPPIRVFGTVGFICSMLLTNFLHIGGVAMQDSYTQLISSGILSLVLCGYALTMPECPVNKTEGKKSFAEAFGLKAFSLFKNGQFAIFFIFSMLLGASLQITNGYANTFLGSFGDIPAYADTFAVKNSNALIAISQASETLCILLIPFFMKKFGIKKVMLISMFAWVLRFGFFGLGNPAMPGVLLFVLSCIVYGMAFDFFNISGSLYVDQNAPVDIRSSAQGVFMLMTNGLGATIGTLAAGAVVDAVGVFEDASQWPTAWYIFAGYAFVVGILFMILFKDPQKKAQTV